jgi:cysteinyl-tRNA synthetase
LLSTHYRRPIEFTDDVVASAKKGLAVFARLIERIERIIGKPIELDGPDMDRIAGNLLDGEHGHFARNVLNFKMKFLEMMDDDFNTAGAIAVLHELAGEINSFIEQRELEKTKEPNLVQAVSAATQSIRKLGMILGLFHTAAKKQAGGSELTERLMKLLIQLRADARVNKNFALADAVRKGLGDIGITLEDRADGTVWRKE